MKSHWKFSQRMHPIHPIGPKTPVLVCFIVFGCICQCFVTTRNLVQNGLNWCNQCTSLCHKVASEFFTTKAPSPPHWTLNSCFGAFLSFGCIWQCFITTRNSVQNGLNWCNYWTSLCYEVASEIFRNWHTQSNPLDPKLMIWCIS